MKRFTTLLTAALFILTVMAAGNLAAQDVEQPITHGPGFVDADGDGYNDNAPDADGDGIPNGQDTDFARGTQTGTSFVDEDGDGINDNPGLRGNGKGLARGTRPQDGTGNKRGFGRQSGTGNGAVGANGTGTGDCMGDGPHGLGRGRK